jgi:hypothetical protein
MEAGFLSLTRLRTNRSGAVRDHPETELEMLKKEGVSQVIR